jgi:hypothetical protein
MKDIARQHLDNFGTYEERKAGPDAVFGPWMYQFHVPEELRTLLTVARAKAGGPQLADRDTRNGAILDGLPDTGLEILAARAERMRGAVGAGHNVGVHIGTYIGKHVPGSTHSYFQERLKKVFKCRFVEEDEIAIDIGPTGGETPEDIFVAAVDGITYHRGVNAHLRSFVVHLTVKGWPQGDEVHKTVPTLTKSWPAEK